MPEELGKLDKTISPTKPHLHPHTRTCSMTCLPNTLLFRSLHTLCCILLALCEFLFCPVHAWFCVPIPRCVSVLFSPSIVLHSACPLCVSVLSSPCMSLRSASWLCISVLSSPCVLFHSASPLCVSVLSSPCIVSHSALIEELAVFCIRNKRKRKKKEKKKERKKKGEKKSAHPKICFASLPETSLKYDLRLVQSVCTILDTTPLNLLRGTS